MMIKSIVTGYFRNKFRTGITIPKRHLHFNYDRNEMIRFYKMATGELEPEYGNHTLILYFLYNGDWKNYEKVTRGNYLMKKYDDKSKDDDFEFYQDLCMYNGIAFNTDFAYWCYEKFVKSSDKNFSMLDLRYQDSIKSKISNRLIMCNDTSFIYKNYCIWIPDIPSEETCRKLFKSNPEMNYLIARVCAIGNYIDLYKELNVLPEVSVMKEAVVSNSKDIVEYMKKTDKYYIILNDYTENYMKEEHIETVESGKFDPSNYNEDALKFSLNHISSREFYNNYEEYDISNNLRLPMEDDFCMNLPYGCPDLLGTGYIEGSYVFSFMNYMKNNGLSK